MPKKRRHRITDPEVRIQYHLDNLKALADDMACADSVTNRINLAKEQRQILDAIRVECQPFMAEDQLERAQAVLQRLETGIAEPDNDTETPPDLPGAGEVH